MESKKIKISDMTCTGCERILERNIETVKGVKSVKVSFAEGTVIVYYDKNVCGEKEIADVIKNAGYSIKSSDKGNLGNIISILIIIVGIYVIFNAFGINTIFQYFPVAKEEMGYFALFVIGLLTSMHCVAMCGGINLTASINNKLKIPIVSALLYNIGRLLSYTVIGGFLGGIGSVVAVSSEFKAAIGIFAGLFVVIMGINMLGGFSFSRRLSLHLPKGIVKRLYGGKIHGSFYIGIVNGFMPCGPLQSMQLLAVASGSVLKGALSMFSFALGTIPLMLLFGAFAGVLNKRFKSVVTTASVVLIIVFGLAMIQNNLALTGITLPQVNNSEDVLVSEVRGDIQYITSDLKPGSYDAIKVKKGIPFQWNIKADKSSLNGCNNEIIISEFNITQKLEEGDNIIEFTPEEEGTFVFSCWMGMIRSNIIVED